MENENFKKGDIVEGIVVSIQNYGIFLSFDKAYVGLLHISEISYNFVNDLKKYFHIGDTVNVMVESVDEKEKFISVSTKNLPDEINTVKNILPSKKITSYLKDIDFSKIEKSLQKMINEELEREAKGS